MDYNDALEYFKVESKVESFVEDPTGIRIPGKNLREKDSHLHSSQISARELLEKPYNEVISRMQGLDNRTDEELLDIYDRALIMIKYLRNVENSVKLSANGLYGAMSSRFFKWYSHTVGSDITAEGRNAIQMSDKYTNVFFKKVWPTLTEFFVELKKEFPEITAESPVSIDFSEAYPCVIYADTDSLFLDLEPVIEAMKINSITTERLTEVINRIIEGPLMDMYQDMLRKYTENRNGKNHYIFELEGVFGKILFCAKKKYFGYYWSKDGNFIGNDKAIKLQGLELIQKKTPQRIKEILKKISYMCLSQKYIPISEFKKIIQETIKEFSDKPILDWAPAKRVTTFRKFVDIDETGHYFVNTGANAVVKGVVTYNNWVIDNGLTQKYTLVNRPMRVKTYYTTDPDYPCFAFPIEDDCPIPHELPEPDVMMNLEKIFFSPVRRMLAPIYGTGIDLLETNVPSDISSMF